MKRKLTRTKKKRTIRRKNNYSSLYFIKRVAFLQVTRFFVCTT